MKNNFKVRLIVSIGLIIVAAVFLSICEGLPFKIFFSTFAAVAAIELCSFFKKSHTPINIILSIAEIAFLILGSITIFRPSLLGIITIILGVCGYDIFAYFFGGLIGGYLFPKSRPFPHISKNKTWEGTFMGLICSFLLCGIFILASNQTNYIYLLCGPLAVIGDLFESMLKRTFKVKDSNEIIVKKKPFDLLEILVGGNAGHGGFLDRIDSIAFTCAVLFFLI